MTNKSPITEQQRAVYQRASEYLNDATCHLQETGVSYADTLITVLYEAASLLDEDLRERSLSEADVAAIMDAVVWLSDTCATTLVRPPVGHRRDRH